MGLFTTPRFIMQHPLGRKHVVGNLWDWVRWQVGSRLVPGPVVVPWVASTRLVVAPSMTGATGNVYVGLHEPVAMGFLLHFLRPSDHFIDVGANIGSFTILAAGVVGAHVDAFEPVGTSIASLGRNIRENHLESRVCVHTQAVGSHVGEVLIETTNDTMNRVLTDIAEEPASGRQRVPVTTLDTAFPVTLAPALIKIDVEGFETEVLAGARQLLTRTAAVIVEVSAHHDKVYAQLAAAGLSPIRYDPFTRRVTPLAAPEATAFGNSLFVRDPVAAANRCREAPQVAVKRTFI